MLFNKVCHPLLHSLETLLNITFFKRRANRPCSTMETSLVILGHFGFLSKLNWSFVGRSSLHLWWPILYSEETLWSLLKWLLKPLLTYCDQNHEVLVFVYVPNLFLSPINNTFQRFYLIYSLELFLRLQSMKVHDLAKHDGHYSLNKNGCNLQMEIVVYND
jgi:hypothetical protein